MKRRLIRRGALFAVLVLLTLGGWALWKRTWGDDERTVTLLSEQVTLGPTPLVIRAPWRASAWGSSFWLIVHLTQEKVCDGRKWTEEAAKLLPTIYATAITSDGQRHPLRRSDCCSSSECGALMLVGHPPDQEPERRLVRVELYAPESVVIKKVQWNTGGMRPVHLTQ
jgi:hypothetical protein